MIDEFKRAGIDASFRAVDWSILLEKVKSFEYDAVILGWTSSGSTPPDLYQIWHSSMAVEGGSNHISFMDEEVDKLLTEYRGEFDAAKRKVIIDRIQEILYDLQPYTFVYAPKSLVRVRPALPQRDLVPDGRGRRSRSGGCRCRSRSTTDERRAARVRRAAHRAVRCRPSSRSPSSASRSSTSRRAIRSSSYLAGGLASGQAGISTQKIADVERAKAELRHELGLDRPIPVQYVDWLGSFVRGDLGRSLKDRQPVWDKIRERLPSRSLINLIALFSAYLVAVPLGIYSAVRPGTRLDQYLDRGDLHALRRAELLARRDADRVLLQRRLPALVPAGRPALAALLRGLVDLAPGRRRAAPPGVAALRHDARRLHRAVALPALVAARERAPGLHPHRARQGRARAHRRS